MQICYAVAMNWFRWRRPLPSAIAPIVALSDGAVAVMHSVEGSVRATARLEVSQITNDDDEREQFLTGLSEVFTRATGPLQLVVCDQEQFIVVAAADQMLLLDSAATLTASLRAIGIQLEWLNAAAIDKLITTLLGDTVITNLADLSNRDLQLGGRAVACTTVVDWPATLDWGDLDWLWGFPEALLSLRVMPLSQPRGYELRDAAYRELEHAESNVSSDLARRLRAQQHLQLADALDQGRTTLHQTSVIIVAQGSTTPVARQRLGVLQAIAAERGCILRECPRTADTVIGALPFGIGYRRLDARTAEQLGAVITTDAQSLARLAPLSYAASTRLS
jgi:hypothetical protein